MDGRIVSGKYNPITVIIPVGETESEAIFLGKKSIIGLYVIDYTGNITFTGSISEEGDLNADTPYASLQKPESDTGAAYTAVSGSTHSMIPIDYTVFATPNYIKLNLASAQLVDVRIEIQPYDIA